MSESPWYRRDEARGVLVLTVQVQPNAARTQVVGLHGDALKIRVAAPAVENKANAQLVAFLAEAFGVRPGAVTLKAGAHGRRKIVEIEGSRIAPETLLNDA